MGVWIRAEWHWGSFSIVSSNLILLKDLTALRGLLENIVPSIFVMDKLVWLKDKENGYSTKSGYSSLVGLHTIPLL